MLNCIKDIAYTLVIVHRGLYQCLLTSLNRVIKSIIIMYCETDIKAIVFGDMM